MIDTHSHIDTTAFNEDRDDIINRAIESKVEYIIVPAISCEGHHNLLEIAHKYDMVYCGIGIHPHNANETNSKNLQQVWDLADNDKVVAIGETGIDYYYDFAPKQIQLDCFTEQIRIGKEKNKPIIVHNREADSDIFKILEKEQDGTLRGVLHCFSSGLDEMRRAIELGFHISFTGNITFKKSNLTEVVQEVPLDRLLLETDSPYMTPVPFRGKRNEPANVKYIAEKISEIKSISINEVIKMTTQNAKSLFKIMMLIISFSLSSVNLFSQDVQSTGTYVYEESPYLKNIGLGVVLGTNTVVETYNVRDDRSWDGLLSIGGTAIYYPLDFMNLQFTYLYAQNTEISDLYEIVEEPSRYHIYEASMAFSPNPYNRISFHLIGGASVIHTIYWDPDIVEMNKHTRFALNAGLGFNFNLPAGSAGLFNIYAEWKLNFIFGSETFDIDPRSLSPDPVDVTMFMSIPRLGVVWFPF